MKLKSKAYNSINHKIYCRLNFFRRGIHGISIEDRILHEADALCDVIRQKNEQPFVLEVRFELIMLDLCNIVLFTF